MLINTSEHQHRLDASWHSTECCNSLHIVLTQHLAAVFVSANKAFVRATCKNEIMLPPADAPCTPCGWVWVKFDSQLGEFALVWAVSRERRQLSPTKPPPSFNSRREISGELNPDCLMTIVMAVKGAKKAPRVLEWWHEPSAADVTNASRRACSWGRRLVTGHMAPRTTFTSGVMTCIKVLPPTCTGGFHLSL